MEAEGKRDDVGMHRPIALILVFRKILEKVLLLGIHGRFGKLDEAQGGFRKKRSTLDLTLALDTVVKEYGRKESHVIRHSSILKAPTTRLTARYYGRKFLAMRRRDGARGNGRPASRRARKISIGPG